MTGIDIPVPECQLVIHQPTIKEISIVGENDFNLGAHLVCINKEDYGNEIATLQDLNNFTLLMKLLEDKEAADKKQTVKQFLLLLLPQYRITITPRSILCNKDSENFIIDEGNFDSLQKVIRRMLCMDRPSDKEDELPEKYNPANAKAEAIAQKIYKGRKQVAEIKANKNPNDSMLARKVSILAVGVGYTPEELNNFTIFQVNNLSTRMAMKIAQDTDERVRIAGGKPDKSPPPWVGPI